MDSDNASATSSNSSASRKHSVLMVCTGNICRSPMAQAVLEHLVQERGLSESFEKIASAGIKDWHVGKTPDERTLAVLQKHTVPWNSRAQQVKESDFSEYTHVLAMDNGHMSELSGLKPENATATVALFGTFGDGKEIADPYFGGPEGFDDTYKQVVAYCEGLLTALESV